MIKYDQINYPFIQATRAGCTLIVRPDILHSEDIMPTVGGYAMDKDILNLEEAADVLKTSRPTLYRWIHEGRIKAFKAGRKWRFYRSDLLAFLETSDQEKEVKKRLLLQGIALYSERLREKGLNTHNSFLS